MKFNLALFGMAIAFASCQNNHTKTAQEAPEQRTDSAAMVSHTLDNGHYCYVLTEGQQNQDSTKIHLLIDGNNVSGEMDWLPSEKDSRKGTVSGTIQGEDVDVVWSYMQEGMPDTLALQFRLTKGMELYQKPLQVNTRSQRQQTDASAAYSIRFAAVDCKL